jgi:hypothetical protein
LLQGFVLSGATASLTFDRLAHSARIFKALPIKARLTFGFYSGCTQGDHAACICASPCFSRTHLHLFSSQLLTLSEHNYFALRFLRLSLYSRTATKIVLVQVRSFSDVISSVSPYQVVAVRRWLQGALYPWAFANSNSIYYTAPHTHCNFAIRRDLSRQV